MQKRITTAGTPQSGTERPGEPQQGWLDLEQIATVELTSEDSRFPIEGAFRSSDGSGWRASEPGDQRIRLIFAAPVSLHRIELCFRETEVERTQEFTIRCWSGSPDSVKEIVRQQWNFSPSGSTTELESYAVNLDSVSMLELAIRPDLRRRDVVASLESFRLR